ncbi:peptidoglycan DD-metalloendopeptidase family protein [Pseudomonas sp. 5P_3.1_Bac2]|uniref:peptidoglycan DD-metalloendopeptidase family protein n=1 Tax=Pseudomonas sp. 5P_3.1_Bac2 TaxID=2971617 RepID=UPI0021C7737F|nr:peptidoglycan DD-metalloendopeptidase family protein [Pseudomonas sp. 5P_3.1_Bac2]MCU1717491.1 peptidoglycan DD-metalloendopeptidase family protein [Pseudomonas sp. 5P_3.1_Bac2]
MTSSTKAPPLYPKSHILAASGVAALLSLALLVFPSREVEAKRTHLNLELDSSAEYSQAENETESATALSLNKAPSPLAQTGETPDTEQASVEAPAPVESKPLQHIVRVENGDTLSTLFAKVGLNANDLHEAINSSKEAKQLSRLKVGQPLEFNLTTDGKLDSVHSKLSDLESIALVRTDKGFSFKRELVKPEVTTSYSRAVINNSLFLSAKRAGLSHNLTMDLANIFGYDIDFALDIRDGDEFELIYEKKVVNGKQVGTGNILSARFTNRGKTYTAVRYTNKHGTTSYYNGKGESMRKAFIRTPVDFARISSRFSNGRRHPILNKIRAHKGVDYAAPRGTPIKAAGDGRVMLAGRHGGYGNAVIIQHGQRYRTLYAHMNGFAKGIRNGVNVRQGQIIGYIGTTGLSTGPHLHYEFQVNGVHVDPLSQKMTMADPIPASEKARFNQLSKPLLAQMDKEKSTMLALNNQR